MSRKAHVTTKESNIMNELRKKGASCQEIARLVERSVNTVSKYTKQDEVQLQLNLDPPKKAEPKTEPKTEPKQDRSAFSLLTRWLQEVDEEFLAHAKDAGCGNVVIDSVIFHTAWKNIENAIELLLLERDKC